MGPSAARGALDFAPATCNRFTMQGTFFGWVTAMVRAHRARLLEIARAQGLGADDALDAAQEAFVSFLALPQARTLALETDDAAKVLSVLAKNVARNARRRHHRARPHASDDATIEALGDEASGVDALLERAELHLKALGCIRKMGEIQRQVVTLRLLEDQPGQAVADLLGINPGHVAVLLHRAKAELRSCIEEMHDVLGEG
ncbi:MAG TPA: sigma-70 family RNA polymerase sigma factor [Polyangiaceae bacterium]|nr:sigma-70 family RNA polymerase sigma factor [Polyangiaceae bacterium]